MRKQMHIRPITQTPGVAQTNFTVKLEGITEIIDRLLLAGRQAPWKTPFPVGGADGDTDTSTDTFTDTTDLSI